MITNPTTGGLKGIGMIEKRLWIQSGTVEELDARQSGLLELVMEKIRFYYEELYRTRPCYQYPLSLSRLSKLCHRSGQTIVGALRLLANTIPVGSNQVPPIYYDRRASQRSRAGIAC